MYLTFRLILIYICWFIFSCSNLTEQEVDDAGRDTTLNIRDVIQIDEGIVEDLYTERTDITQDSLSIDGPTDTLESDYLDYIDFLDSNYSDSGGDTNTGDISSDISVSHNVFIPTAAVLYGTIGKDRPENCYPLEEAAKFSFLDLSTSIIGKTKRWCKLSDGTYTENQIKYIKSINESTIIFLYRFSPTEINWVASKKPASGKEYFEKLISTNGIGSEDRWFAIGKRSGDYLVDMNYPQYVAMEMGNQNWVSFWIEQGWEDMWGDDPVVNAKGSDGILVDGAQMYPYSNFPFCPMSKWDTQNQKCLEERDYPDTYWDNGWKFDLYKQHLFTFIERAVPWYRGRNIEMMFNVWKLNDEYVAFLNQIKAHAMEECGFICISRYPPDRTHWEGRLKNLQNAKNFSILNTNTLIIPSGSGIQKRDEVVLLDKEGREVRGWDVLWFAMTSFLLGYDPEKKNGYFHFSVGGDKLDFYRDAYWFDEYESAYLDLGKPLGLASKNNSGVWERRFERGWVWVNMSDTSQSVEVPSGRARIVDHYTFKDPQNVEPVDGFRLGPARGVIGLLE